MSERRVFTTIGILLLCYCTAILLFGGPVILAR